MARVERYTLTEPVTVKQAGIINPSDFRFSNISAQMLQMGGEVLYELGRRELEAKNSLAINAAVESRSLAKLKMREFMANNPEPDTWSKGAEKILAEQGKIYSQQRFNAKTRAEQQIEQQAFKDKLNTEVGIAAVTQNIENDIAISGKNLVDVISTDDGSPEMAADILDQQKTYQEALERKYPKDVAVIHMEETLAEAEKLKVEKVKEEQMNLAAIKSELMISYIGAELKARKKGKKAIQEFALLSNVDLEAIRDYAKSVGEEVKSDSKITASAAIEDSYAKIVGGDLDIVSMIMAIQNDPTISDDDSNTAVEKIKTFFSTWHSAVDDKIVTSDSTRVKALKIISAVRTADITREEGLTQYIKLSKAEKINGIDGKGFINGIFAASKSAEGDPLSTNRAKIYFGNLETLYKDGDIKPLEFDRMHTALRKFFEQEPPPTPEQAVKFYDELVNPIVLNWFEKLMWSKGRRQLFGLVGTEEERLAKKRAKAGVIEDLSTMTDSELEAIIRGK